MDPVAIIFIILLVIVAVLVVVQIQIRKRHLIESKHDAEQSMRLIEQALRSRGVSVDQEGNLASPFGPGQVLAHASDGDQGAYVQVWLSSYPFMSANGFQVLAYRSVVGKIRKAVSSQ